MNYTQDERKKIIEKGRRGLIAYLSKESEEELCDESRKRLFKVSNIVFREYAENNFDKIDEFCSKRRKSEEKDDFYFNLMRAIVKDVRKIYNEKYPA